MNEVRLVGTLTRDPQFLTSQKGSAYARFSVKVERDFNGKSFSTIVDVTAFEGCVAALQGRREGDELKVLGYLSVSKFVPKGSDKEVWKLGVVCENLTVPAARQVSAGGSSGQDDSVPF